ncbi:nucleotide sugar dehydrogenase [Nitrospina watsonii]|uniref:UDP-N-acetyl-D-glucosamine 6-dehydrogenase n=1 Tax=Nitrospina watsonii TaxID=1323948 RepID=A0ABM9HA35_9BACT|nr:nucleotide sugar dehydrogenase [Nitrospina watsonii]CAI2716986.1 UDP-N-acetyl-D-glucosamine 6-dehydrogenase [Nitrospina watsonii]
MFEEKIKNRQARIGVVGLGYVGLPVLLAFGKNGFPVLGLDVDADKVEQLNCGRSYIHHIPEEAVRSLLETGRFQTTTDFSRASGLDAVLICVPTPLTQHREPDMRYIVATARALSPHLVANQLIVLESTTYPGTTRDVLIPELESQTVLRANRDFWVAYSPEREDPNNREFSVSNVPKVIGADHPTGLQWTESLYGAITQTTVPIGDTRVAEAAKLMENVFRSVNIALVNELKVIFDRMGIDIWQVIDVAKTKPFGYMPFFPGPGLGGHCIPIDPFYLSWKAKEYGIVTRFIELAGEINVSMPNYVMEKIQSALNRQSKSVRGSCIFILGVAYKKDVDDDRESVSFKIMETIEAQGGSADFHDPYIAVIGDKKEYPHFTGKQRAPLEDMGRYDLTVILTDHSAYDYDFIVKESRMVVDTRNACRHIQSDKIIKA